MKPRDRRPKPSVAFKPGTDQPMKKNIALLIGFVAAAFLIGFHLKTRDNAGPALATTQPEPVVRVEGGDRSATQRPVHGAPLMSPAPVEARSAEKTVLQRIASNDTNVFKLSPERIQAFLARNQTNADSLLAAFNITHDQEYLREAARRFPSNACVLMSLLNKSASPEQRRELIDQFKQLSPENALANYLSASEYAKP